MNTNYRRFKVIIDGLPMRKNAWLVDADNVTDIYKQFSGLILKQDYKQYTTNNNPLGGVWRYVFLNKDAYNTRNPRRGPRRPRRGLSGRPARRVRPRRGRRPVTNSHNKERFYDQVTLVVIDLHKNRKKQLQTGVNSVE